MYPACVRKDQIENVSERLCLCVLSRRVYTQRENPPVTFEENECGYVCVCVWHSFSSLSVPVCPRARQIQNVREMELLID